MKKILWKAPEWVKLFRKGKWPEMDLQDTQKAIAEKFMEIQERHWTMAERVIRWTRHMSKLSDLEWEKPYFIDTETGEITYTEDNQELLDEEEKKEAIIYLWLWGLNSKLIANHIAEILWHDNLWLELIAAPERDIKTVEDVSREAVRDILRIPVLWNQNNTWQFMVDEIVKQTIEQRNTESLSPEALVWNHETPDLHRDNFSVWWFDIDVNNPKTFEDLALMLERNR